VEATKRVLSEIIQKRAAEGDSVAQRALDVLKKSKLD
jgi:hypothetical protein